MTVKIGWSLSRPNIKSDSRSRFLTHHGWQARLEKAAIQDDIVVYETLRAS